MAPYSHQVNTYKRSKRARRSVKIAYTAITLVVIFGLIVGLDYVVNKLRNDEPSVNNLTTSSVQSATINVFQSPYFRFQADSSWKEVTDQITLKNTDGSEKTYKYISYNSSGDLVQRDLEIKINPKNRDTLANTQISRVVPIRINNGFFDVDGEVSPHCSEFVAPGDKKQQLVIYKQTEFPCNPDTGLYYAVAGLIGGNEMISSYTQGGDGIIYKITYRDSTFYPTSGPFVGILNTFQIL